jgi:hypothetical protein
MSKMGLAATKLGRRVVDTTQTEAARLCRRDATGAQDEQLAAQHPAKASALPFRAIHSAVQDHRDRPRGDGAEGQRHTGGAKPRYRKLDAPGRSLERC